MKRIAIVSTNRNKYSETFIQMHKNELQNVCLVLSDGYFPSTYSLNRGKSYHQIGETKKWWHKFSKKNTLKRLLLKERVEVVFAEYGQSGVEMCEVCDELGIPLIVHFHGFDAYRNDALSSYGKKYPQMFQLASAVIVVSKDMRKQLLDLGCPVDKLKFIPYGIDTELFKPNFIENRKFQFVTCGRFVEKKNPLKTIRAFHQVWLKNNSLQLVMIGDGELLEEAKKMVDELKLNDSVEFTGVLCSNDVVQKLNESVCFLQHSVTTSENDSEGTPLAILEAMACGLTVVATKHGGIVDVIDHGVNGYLVDEFDVDGMADCMTSVIQNHEKSKIIGKNARKTIEQNYHKQRYINDLQVLLNSC